MTEITDTRSTQAGPPAGQLIGLEAIYRRPSTSKRCQTPGHKVYPYMLRGLEINRVNQVWASLTITWHTHGSGFPLLDGHHGLGTAATCWPWRLLQHPWR